MDCPPPAARPTAVERHTCARYAILTRATRRSAGVRTARPLTASGPAALTDTEAGVARLVAAGHTNRAAAELLGVSANTVGSHLRAVFGKLGIQSRVQLANLMHDAAPAY